MMRKVEIEERDRVEPRSAQRGGVDEAVAAADRAVGGAEERARRRGRR